jgi:hypothetical protein
VAHRIYSGFEEVIIRVLTVVEGRNMAGVADVLSSSKDERLSR